VRFLPNLVELLVAIGLAAAPPTALLGLADYSGLDERQRRVGFVHAVVDSTALSCYAASYVLRRRDAHTAGKLLGLVTLSAGGRLGGHLSYTGRGSAPVAARTSWTAPPAAIRRAPRDSRPA